ncbi:glycosyltransferase family 31 protein [Curvularia clavata]|uniref:N-acetylgalactosaminide beta-1,3-galactosyltransferase n=1 Tax=Curvularia clavata TaxID=95742 RepID=A0A9Q9DS45_CURCL|nr:glycosyltransferase family 31 protein [Curvularia clavata]
MPRDGDDDEERGKKGGRERAGTRYIYTRRRSPIGLLKRNRLVLALTVCVLTFIVRAYRYYPATSTQSPPSPCPNELGGASNDILVVLRTGATEALSKVPIHFSTTLRCVPNYVLYSDLEENIAGHRVHDVFANGAISHALSESHELRFYHHLKKLGRQGLLALQATTKHDSSLGTTSDNPAWQLDRFKFLPMISQALKHRPSAKWFVFIEADTYLVWQNLVSYLRLFDATKPLYIGKHMYMDDVLFAHGGSGFVLSRPAMLRVVEQRDAHVARYDALAKESAAGDMLLGKILADVQVPLFSAFPHFQGDAVTGLDGNVSKVERRPWCYAPVTYHHMREDEIRALWGFEERWMRESDKLLRHADVFKSFLLPRLRPKLDGWDNFSLDSIDSSSDSAAAVPSTADCEARCEANSACLQFSYETAAGNCATSTRVVLGEAARRQCVEYSSAAGRCVRWQGDGDDDNKDSRMGNTTPGLVQSGWMMHRLQRYVEEMDSMCSQEKMSIWVV